MKPSWTLLRSQLWSRASCTQCRQEPYVCPPWNLFTLFGPIDVTITKIAPISLHFLGVSQCFERSSEELAIQYYMYYFMRWNQFMMLLWTTWHGNMYMNNCYSLWSLCCHTVMTNIASQLLLALIFTGSSTLSEILPKQSTLLVELYQVFITKQTTW